MARLGDEFLDENPVIAEEAGRLVLGALKALARLFIVPGNPHALAAAARRGLDHHRIADFIGNLHRLFGVLDQPHIAGHRDTPAS